MSGCNAAVLPFSGICPPTELECPPCPLGHVKCPGGGCSVSIRLCEPNVWAHGPCNASTCERVEQCHLLLQTQLRCWEVAPSEATATMLISDLGTPTCSRCQGILSRYVCDQCCSVGAIVSWNSSYAAAFQPGGSGHFMAGTKCALFTGSLASSALPLPSNGRP